MLVAACVALAGCGAGEAGKAVAPILTWGQSGTLDGWFSLPRVIDSDSSGTVYVIDKTGRVQLFSPDGAFLSGWQLPAMDNGKPTGMCIGPDGHLYIADTHNSRIVVYSRDGKLLRQWGTYGTGPGQFIYATDVAVNDRGEVFATDYGKADRVMKFDADGRFLTAWGTPGEGPGEFQRPMAIALDGRGHAYVADTANHRVQKFTEDGRLVHTVGGLGKEMGRMKYPYDVAVGEDGVYVCEYGNCRVQKLTLSGEPVMCWGSPGRDPGMFAQPWGVTSRGGSVFVADTGNHRIQKFRL